MTQSLVKMASLWLLLLSLSTVLARPQVGVVLVPAEHRLGDVAIQPNANSERLLNEEKPENQTASYAFSYVVSSDASSTYIAQREAREGAQVHGQYSYVDPNGALITVQYKAGPEGYAETRTTQHDFHSLRAQESGTSTTTPATTSAPIPTSTPTTTTTTTSTTTTTTQPPPPNSSSEPEVEPSSIPSAISSEAALSSDNGHGATAAISPPTGHPESSAEEDALFMAEDTRFADNSLLVDMILSELRPLITDTVTRVLGTSKRAKKPTPPAPPIATVAQLPGRFSASPVQLQQQEIILPVSIIGTTSDLSTATAKDAQADEVFAHTRANTIRFQNPDVKFVAHI